MKPSLEELAAMGITEATHAIVEFEAKLPDGRVEPRLLTLPWLKMGKHLGEGIFIPDCVNLGEFYVRTSDKLVAQMLSDMGKSGGPVS